jgi:hypothetical protein
MKKQQPDGKETFLDISTHLTGFEAIDLQGTGMVEVYYNYMVEMEPQNSQYFLKKAREIMDHNRDNEENLNEAIAAQLIPNNYFNGIAKKVIIMWYLGNWESNVISPESYVAGLVWPAADTKPYGAKQPGFGSWAQPPIQLDLNGN